jgi:hypothetical protein
MPFSFLSVHTDICWRDQTSGSLMSPLTNLGSTHTRLLNHRHLVFKRISSRCNVDVPMDASTTPTIERFEITAYFPFLSAIQRVQFLCPRDSWVSCQARFVLPCKVVQFCCHRTNFTYSSPMSLFSSCISSASNSTRSGRSPRKTAASRSLRETTPSAPPTSALYK